MWGDLSRPRDAWGAELTLALQNEASGLFPTRPSTQPAPARGSGSEPSRTISGFSAAQLGVLGWTLPPSKAFPKSRCFRGASAAWCQPGSLKPLPTSLRLPCLTNGRKRMGALSVLRMCACKPSANTAVTGKGQASLGVGELGARGLCHQKPTCN